MSAPLIPNKQAGGKSRVGTRLLATLIGILAVGALSHKFIVKPAAVAEAPNGYLAVVLAYVDGKLVRPFTVDANVDLATCKKEDYAAAQKLGSSDGAPEGVSFIGECYAMPNAPAESSAPKAPLVPHGHVGQQGDETNSTTL